MNLQGWYPLALARDVQPGTSAGTRVEGKEIVVWRDVNGAPHAWEDRCPHRGMKLSFGFVRGDHIACLYHGWQYDTAGQCRYIPAHPDLKVPKSITVPTFGVAELGGIIWGSFDTEEERPPLPEMPEGITALRSVFVDCPAGLFTDLIGLFADLIKGTPFDDTNPEVTMDGRVMEIRLGGVTLLAALQPVAEKEAALHIVASGDLPANKLKSLTFWTEQLRRDVETAAIDGTAAEIAA